MSEGSPRTNECRFVLVVGQYVDLVVTGETVHKREDFTTGTIIDNLIDEGSWIVVLWTCFVQIPIIDTHSNGSLFFRNGYDVGYPFS